MFIESLRWVMRRLPSSVAGNLRRLPGLATYRTLGVSGPAAILRGFRRAAFAVDGDPRNRSGVESICECIWELEAKHSLLSWQVNGVFPWPLARMRVYYRATQLAGIFTPPHPALKEQFRGISGTDREAITAYWEAQEAKHKALHSGNPPSRADSKLYAILMATRKIDGSEPYSRALRDEIGNDALLLDRPQKDHAGPNEINFPALLEIIRARYKKPQHAHFPRRDRILCDRIRREFASSLGVDPGNIEADCYKQVRAFLPTEHGFKVFFEANPFETLFLTNGYGSTNQAVISAARACGVRTVELQHGFISRFHLGYSWPGRPHVPYTADELWCFGKFWPEATPLPARMAARAIGAPYVRELAAGADARNEKLVVFTSQGVIGLQLFELALKTAQRRPDLEVVFRLHPSESLAMYEKPLAARGVKPGNFRLSHRDPNIFKLLAQTAVQVGAFSTTLFEGMSLGTRTVVVNLPGSEYMRPVIERGDAVFAETLDELVEKIDQAPLAADPEFYYAKPVARLVLDAKGEESRGAD